MAPDLGHRPQRRHPALVHLHRSPEDLLGDDLEHPPGPGELGLHLGSSRHGPGPYRLSLSGGISDVYYPRYADERRRGVVDPLLHGPRRRCPRTRRCRPPGWPSSTTCRRRTWPRRCRRWPAAGIVESAPGAARRLPAGAPARGHLACSTSCSAVDGDEHGVPVRRDPPARTGGATAGSPRLPPAVRHRRVMWRAEDAWRAELAAVTVGDIVTELFATVPAAQLVRGAEWIQDVDVRRRSRT